MATAYDILATDIDPMKETILCYCQPTTFAFALYIAIMGGGNKSLSIFLLCLLWWGREEASMCLYIPVFGCLVLNKHDNLAECYFLLCAEFFSRR